MANPIFRPYPVYINGKKIAEINSSTFEAMDGGANQIGLDGVIGQSDGAIETKLDADTVVPVAGMEFNLDDILKSRARVGIGVVVNGRMQIVEGKLTGTTYSSDSKTGECKGKYSFIGGEAQLV